MASTASAASSRRSRAASHRLWPFRLLAGALEAPREPDAHGLAALMSLSRVVFEVFQSFKHADKEDAGALSHEEVMQCLQERLPEL